MHSETQEAVLYKSKAEKERATETSVKLFFCNMRLSNFVATLFNENCASLTTAQIITPFEPSLNKRVLPSANRSKPTYQNYSALSSFIKHRYLKIKQLHRIQS